MKKLKAYFGWFIIVLLSFTPILFWSLVPKTDNPFRGVQNSIISLGEIFGLVGMVMFSLNFILSTRLSFIEKLFVGLNNVYKSHNLLGQLAFILLLFHPLFLTLRYASNFKEGASFLFFGNVWSRNFGIISLWMMVFLITLTLYLRPKYNLWKITHKFFGMVLYFATLHVYFIPGYIMNNLLLKGYVLTFAVFGILAFLYKSIFGKYFLRTHKYVVRDINHLNDKVIEVILMPKKDKLKFNAGQFVFVSFNQDGLYESHPFSISSGPDESLLRITIKSLGDYTKTLKNKLRKGTLATIEGPYGVFSYKNTVGKNQIWIAGGIGITPFISFIKDCFKKRITDMNIKLFYCVKNKQDAIYLFFLKKTELILNDFSVIPFFSEEKGYIDIQYIKQQTENFAESDFFICAPPRMIKELRKNLMANGISKNKVHSEEFNF